VKRGGRSGGWSLGGKGELMMKCEGSESPNAVETWDLTMP